MYCCVKEIEFNIKLNISIRDGGNQAKCGDVESKNKSSNLRW